MIRKLVALVVACCAVGAFLALLATVVLIPGSAHGAEVEAFDAMWIDLNGEQHLVLSPSGQQKLSDRFAAKESEIVELRLQLNRARRACPET